MSRLRLIIDVKPKTKSWDVTWRGFGRTQTFTTKAEATYRAVEDAKEHEFYGGVAQVVIRKQDGRIQSERTYGADPKRRPG